jgi:hypothetical protein
MNADTLHRAIELCLAIYRITDKFPGKEVLGPKMRAKSIDILEDLVYYRCKPTDSSRIFNTHGLEKRIRVLFGYFAVAEKQGWVDARNFHVLREAYRDFYRTAGQAPSGNGGSMRKKNQPSLSPRQEKILDFLRINEAGQAISDIAAKIQTSNKTAERELKKMILSGLARKHGNTRGARFIADNRMS